MKQEGFGTSLKQNIKYVRSKQGSRCLKIKKIPVDMVESNFIIYSASFEDSFEQV